MYVIHRLNNNNVAIFNSNIYNQHKLIKIEKQIMLNIFSRLKFGLNL